MSRRTKTLAGLACLFLLALAPAAHAARSMEVAVQDDPLLVNGQHGNLPLGLKLTERLGGSWIRANVVWSYVVDRYKRRRTAPANIQYNWTGYDNLVAGAEQHGIHVQLALTGPAPAWATGNHKVGPVKPKAGAFADFARAAAEHFRGHVTRYSIWNEPNYVGWISPLRSAPRVYRALYQSG
jgi:beta-glucosidase/6-phospho-beta-glucosidase/beta-galactosidase